VLWQAVFSGRKFIEYKEKGAKPELFSLSNKNGRLPPDYY
jgi:hypothetical protein